MSGLADEQAASREPGAPEERVSPSLLIIQQLGQIGQQISRLEGRFDQMAKRFDRLEQRVDRLDGKIDGVEHRLEARIDELRRDVDGMIGGLDLKLLAVVNWAAGTFIAVLGSAGAIVVTVVLHR